MLKTILATVVAGAFLTMSIPARAEEKAPSAPEKAEKSKKEKKDKKDEGKKDEKAGGW